MEDARFVRFVDDDGTATYYATYTAFDGADIASSCSTTTDFVTFSVVADASAPAAANKGLALFPRRIGGRYRRAVPRTTARRTPSPSPTTSRCWPAALPMPGPAAAWEVIQVGNCGSPIETDDGWLVLTHGVGPMRTY